MEELERKDRLSGWMKLLESKNYRALKAQLADAGVEAAAKHVARAVDVDVEFACTVASGVEHRGQMHDVVDAFGA